MPLSRFTVRPGVRSWLVGCVLFAGTVLLFSRSAGYGFINYDDPIYVTSNKQVQAGLAWESIVWAFSATVFSWHPLTWLSHMLDWQLYGGNAAGHHLTSVAWHAVNAVLVFFLLRRLSGAFWVSAFSAALFAWHPLRVESVTWIAERKDLMSGCFSLLTLWSYIRYAENRIGKQPAWPRYLLTLALFVCALMCKPMAVTLPAVLLVLDFWPLRRFSLKPGGPVGPATAGPWTTWRGLILEKIPFFALSLVVSIMTVLTQHDTGAFTLSLPLDARLLNAAVSVARYLGKFFWPFDLTVFYPHPGYWPAGFVIGSILLIVALTALGGWQRNNRPWLLAGWGWFLIMLLPAIGIIQVGFQSMADRYTYLPILGVHLAMFGPQYNWPVRPALRWFIAACAGILLFASIARTWNQQATWHDPFTLYGHAIAVTEGNDTAEAFTGFTLFNLGRIDEATPHCERALAINPRNHAALTTLACIREQQGRYEEAVALCRTVLQYHPQDARTEYLLGAILLNLGKTDDAMVHMKSAAGRSPEIFSSNLQLALTEARQGRPEDALPYFAVALAVKPNDPEVRAGLGHALVLTHRPKEAAAQWEEALRLKPDFPGLREQLQKIRGKN